MYSLSFILQDLLYTSDDAIKETVLNFIKEYKQDVPFMVYHGGLQHCIDRTIDKAWLHYMDKFCSCCLYNGSIEAIIRNDNLKKVSYLTLDGNAIIRLPHVSFYINQQNKPLISPMTREDSKLSPTILPPLSDQEIAELLIWFDGVVKVIDEEARSLYMKLEQENVIDQITQESFAPYKESLSENHQIVSYITFVSEQEKERCRRILEASENHVHCSFASFKEYKSTLSRENVRKLMSNPDKLLARMKPLDKKPSCLHDFGRESRRNQMPLMEDSFLREMRILAYDVLKEHGIAVKLCLLKDRVRIHAVQYQTSRRLFYHITEVFDLLSDEDTIREIIEPFKYPTNFIGLDPYGYADCY